MGEAIFAGRLLLTIRRRIIQLLGQGLFTARDISRILGIKEKEVYDHLPHIQRTLGLPAGIVRQPAACLDCDFVFRKRERFTTPGKCPVCRSQRITEPVFGIDGKDGARKPPREEILEDDR